MKIIGRTNDGGAIATFSAEEIEAFIHATGYWGDDARAVETGLNRAFVALAKINNLALIAASVERASRELSDAVNLGPVERDNVP